MLTLIVACVGIWLLELVTWERLPWIWQPLLLVDSDVLRGQVWQLVTYQFLHAPFDIAHVVFNMLILGMFGRELEWRWGGPRLLAFYLTCGVGGGIAFVLFGLFDPGPTIALGASGAVLGVMTAWCLIWPDRQVLVMFVIPMKAKVMLWVTAVLELVMAWNPDSGVANFAHLGGMLTAWVWLGHGGRLGRVGHAPGAVGAWFSGLARRRRMAKFKSFERDLERWLDEKDDTTRH